MDAYLHTLINRHRAIDEEIARASRRPLAEPKVRALKRLRLAIKDRIFALQRVRTRQSA